MYLHMSIGKTHIYYGDLCFGFDFCRKTFLNTLLLYMIIHYTSGPYWSEIVDTLEKFAARYIVYKDT